MSKDNPFYLEYIPQSEYRRIQSKEGHAREVMDIGVSHLHIQDPVLMQEVKDKILLETETLLRAILPEETSQKVMEGAHLQSLLAALGVA